LHICQQNPKNNAHIESFLSQKADCQRNTVSPVKKDCRRANNHVQRQLMLNALSLKKTENSESKHDIAADDINHGQCGFTYSHFGSIIIMHDYSSKDLKTKELNRGMSIEV